MQHKAEKAAKKEAKVGKYERDENGKIIGKNNGAAMDGSE